VTARTLRLFFLPAVPLMSGCLGIYSHPKPSILPPYIQKIAIRPFANHTQPARVTYETNQGRQTGSLRRRRGPEHRPEDRGSEPERQQEQVGPAEPA